MKHSLLFSVLLVTSCASPTVTPDILGLPVNADDLQQVYGFIDTNGPIALNTTAASPLQGERAITFVAGAFACGTTANPNGTCLGFTHTSYSGATTTVAMVTDTYADESNPTADVRCTALAHELTHVLSWQLIGDPDSGHTNVALWGSYGLVQSALNTLCPGLPPRPQNLEAHTR